MSDAVKRKRRQKKQPATTATVLDPAVSAEEAGLRYITDVARGYRRKKRGKTFCFVDTNGKTIRDPEELRRIRSLVIPPAWEDVWICPSPRGHLQATGHDARGRKQYRYHARWREVRDEAKFERMAAFGRALPALRKRVSRDLALPGMPRNKVLAMVVRLLGTTLIRVGNEEYARDNDSFGLTTMRDKHVEVTRTHVRFRFRGKGGKNHRLELKSRLLARLVKRCQDLPGQELFQYLDENGEPHSIDSTEVNAYLQEITGQPFTAKDFRTWAGTVLTARALQELQEFKSVTQAKKNLIRAVEAVASMLGNTPTVCRRCYVHPAVMDSYVEGALLAVFQRSSKTRSPSNGAGLRPEEACVLTLLRQRVRKAA